MKRKKAVINLQNEDSACFAWSIIAAICPPNGKPHRISSYTHYDTRFNFNDIEFPMNLKDVPKFEKLNNISVNVFGLEPLYKAGKNLIEVVGPLYFTSQRQVTHVNLILIYDDHGKHHYCLITNLATLVVSQKNRHKGRCFICYGCLQFFRTLERLQAHEMHDCSHISKQLPKSDLILNKYGELLPGNMLKFTNFEKQLPVPFVIYADFESLFKPIHHNEPSISSSFTVDTMEHEPYSFGLYVKCNFDDSFSKYHFYRGPTAAEEFTKKLGMIVIDLYHNHLKHVKKMIPLSDAEEKVFKKVVCVIFVNNHLNSMT